MRIFTVASAELISKPVSLVNMDSTERRSQTLCQARFKAEKHLVISSGQCDSQQVK